MESSEEEVEELYSEQPLSRTRRDSMAAIIYNTSQPKTESFHRFVLDEVMIARAMMKTNNPLQSLSERQRQRALKIREGIAVNTSGVDYNTANLDGFGWPGPPQIRSTKCLPPLTDRVKEGAKPSKQSCSVRPKGAQEDFGLEGWTVPPITSKKLPFGREMHLFSDSGDVKPTEKESKNLDGAAGNSKRRGRASLSQSSPPEVVNDCFPVENATSKAHAISSKPIEESVFPSTAANPRQGEHNGLNEMLKFRCTV